MANDPSRSRDFTSASSAPNSTDHRADRRADHQELGGDEYRIRVDTVSMVYRTRSGPVHALGEISFDIRDSEFVSILGPSGCGKSTLINIIGGLVRPSSGTVRLSDRLIDRPVADVGVVFQRDLLLPWRSALQNIMLQAEIRGLDKVASRRRALDLLNQVGLEGFAEKLPAELSGGMRQRVAIVRALLPDPPVLLMDEPFGALDALTRDQMNLDILEIWQAAKKTVAFVTHSIEEAVFLSDRVLVMSSRPGLIQADITIDLPRPRHLNLRDSPEFRAYCRQIRQLFEEMGFLRERMQEQAHGRSPGQTVGQTQAMQADERGA